MGKLYTEAKPILRERPYYQNFSFKATPRGLALGLALVLFRVSVLEWCSLRRFLTSLLHVIYHNTQG
jgi:hypothetical protein